MEHKTLEHKTIKATTTATDKGQFSALAATYAVDRVNDRIIPGAFAKTIAAWQASGKALPLHWNHSEEAQDVIGAIDPVSMREMEDGLYVEGKLDLEGSEVAREVWRSIKNNVIALSFGYLTTRERKGKGGVNELLEIDLFEITLCTGPVQPGTSVLSFKAVANGEVPTEEETDEHEEADPWAFKPESEAVKELEDLPVEDGSDEEPVEAKSAPQDPLRKRSMELAIGFTREGMPRYEPEVEQVEERPSVAELRKRSFEAVLKIADL